ncbi:site-specific integrase [Halorubrum sp. AJ67]|uniref:tyrosine-type recombinase/integrase n=1 Tax=Halorubrum sp. AJ67 TaxID=1173487 RepID=UPI0003DD5D78|nr:site-specific integrase [Halorubrum sp. AJ67]CDK39498.1 integrase family protein [Halorubrum sp. AJ67]
MTSGTDEFGEGLSMDDVSEFREGLASDLNRNLDQLKDKEDTIRKREEKVGVDSLMIFWTKGLEGNSVSERTKESYRTLFRQWRNHMESEGRHLACPSEENVRNFVQYLSEVRENGDKTVSEKLKRLNAVFKFWQDDGAFPHNKDFNPVSSVLKSTSFHIESEKPPHQIELEELREIVGSIKHQRDLAIVTSLLKLGVRATALSNVKLRDISLSDPDIQEVYPELGTSQHVRHRENAIYIPHDRQGNKSYNPRVMPLDDELRRAIRSWLLIRWDNDEPHLFLGKDSHSKMGRDGINNVMKKYFPEKYLQDTELHTGITSKYGRHRFTTHWKVQENINGQKLLYMRGDAKAGKDFTSSDAISSYLHTYYDDIREPYLSRIYKLGI